MEAVFMRLMRRTGFASLARFLLLPSVMLTSAWAENWVTCTRPGVEMAFFQSPQSWHEAERQCQSLGGHLATKRTANETQCATKAIEAVANGCRETACGNIWMGLHSFDVAQATFHWVGESNALQPADQTVTSVWAPNQPEGGGVHPCAAWVWGYRMTDHPCAETSKYICQRPARLASTSCKGKTWTYHALGLDFSSAMVTCHGNGQVLADTGDLSWCFEKLLSPTSGARSLPFWVRCESLEASVGNASQRQCSLAFTHTSTGWSLSGLQSIGPRPFVCRSPDTTVTYQPSTTTRASTSYRPSTTERLTASPAETTQTGAHMPSPSSDVANTGTGPASTVRPSITRNSSVVSTSPISGGNDSLTEMDDAPTSTMSKQTPTIPVTGTLIGAFALTLAIGIAAIAFCRARGRSRKTTRQDSLTAARELGSPNISTSEPGPDTLSLQHSDSSWQSAVWPSTPQLTPEYQNVLFSESIKSANHSAQSMSPLSEDTVTHFEEKKLHYATPEFLAASGSIRKSKKQPQQTTRVIYSPVHSRPLHTMTRKVSNLHFNTRPRDLNLNR